MLSNMQLCLIYVNGLYLLFARLVQL